MNISSLLQYLDLRLIARVRLFTIISMVMLILAAFEVFKGTISISPH